MSVYLGLDKVGVSYAYGGNLYDCDRKVMSDDIYTPWVRPEGWPDLDSLNLNLSGETSFVYMTFRTGHVEDIFSCALNTSSGTATIEIGNISNGVFSASNTYSISSGGSFTFPFTPLAGFSEGTIVIKITGRLTKFYLKDFTRDNTEGGGTIKYYMQPMLERIWYMPEMTHFYDGSSTSTTGNGTYTIERDKFGNNNGNNLTNMTNAWYYCYRLQSLDISNLNTHNVTTMSQAFYLCTELEYLDVSLFDTAKVTTINSMFYHCRRVKLLDLRNWNTLKLTGTGAGYLFCGCWALLQILGLENFYTNNLTSLVSMFNTCYSLKDLTAITYWNVGKVTNMSSLFYSCTVIKTLNLSHWDVSKVTTVASMFYYCQNLEHILFPLVLTGTLSGSQANLFYLCYNLLEIDVSWLKPITNAVTNIGYMFYHCRSVLEINIPEGWDITGCTASEACYRIFSDCYKVLRITGISNWDMSGYNYTLAYSFENCMCLKELDIKNWCPHPTTMYYAFIGCRALETIDLTGWHWENLTGNAIANAFDGCNSLKEIKGIEHMGDSGNITSFASVFSSCWSLASIPNISSWNPAKVTTCGYMFYECRSLKSITITNWSLPKCTNLTYMFRYCYNLEELELTGWSIPLVTTVDYIFNQLYVLKKFSGLPLAVSYRSQEMFSLPEDQWIRVFTLLPTVSGKTINMTTANINRLTSTTKAIATNKGWTLAN